MYYRSPSDRRQSDDADPAECASINSLILNARNEADVCRRRLLFLEAIQHARKSRARGLEIEALAQAVLFNIGGGYSKELLCLFWPLFSDLDKATLVFECHIKRHWLLWAAEKILYFAPDYPEVPLLELHRAIAALIAATESAGGYERKACLRLQLHHSLRLGWIEKAHPLMKALEAAEPENTLKPRPELLPQDHKSKRDCMPTDFGCTAYANQIRVIYYCANNDARSAWRCARYLVDGRSACELALCGLAPREALASLLEPLVEAGMPEEAAAAHMRGLSMVINKPEAVGWFGHHLRYMVRTGATSQAYALLKPLLVSRGDSGTAPSATPFHRFHFLRGALAVLNAKKEQTIESELLRKEAVELARKFDGRGGSDFFIRQLKRDSMKS
jgi:hypothetical protein